MKRTVQLYIDGQQVELFDDENISINSTIQNIKDIGKVFGDFSQSFSVPASKTNNRIFKHYYNSDIQGGFNAQIKTDATLEINYNPFKKGKIKLEEIQMKNNKPYAYKLTFFSSIVSLKDILGEDELSDLDWLSNFDTEYSFTKVRDLLSNGDDITVDSVTYTDAILAPLISAEQRWFYDSSYVPATDEGNLYEYSLSSNLSGVNYLDLKYAIKLNCIIKAIEEKYNIANGYSSDVVFSSDFFKDGANTVFENLYLWLHREKGRFVTGELNEYLNKMPVGEYLNGFSSQGNYFSINDVFSWFGAAESYTPTLHLLVSSAVAKFTITLESVYDGVVYSSGELTSSTSYTVNFPTLTKNGTYKIKITSDQAISIYGNNTTAETYLEVDRVAAVSGATSSNNFEFTADQVMASSLQFNIQDQIPKMKTIDFLTGLFKMFNLTAYVDNGTIKVMPLDDYYALGSSFDITEYVDISDSSVSPITLYNNITFKYDGLNSYITKKHEELFNLEWGTEQYNIENKYEGVPYTISSPFEHMKYERIYDTSPSSGLLTSIQWGWSIDDFNVDDAGNDVPSTSVGNPLVFYAYRQTSGNSIRIHDSSTKNSRSIYYIPSNSVDITASQTINFKAEINEYAQTVFTDNLFSTYYSDYISDIFDSSNRITRIMAYLPLKVLLKYQLYDTFIVAGREYRINSITTDLNTGKSQIELLNIV